MFSLNMIPEEEIFQAAVYVLSVQYSMPIPSLVKETSKTLGFKVMRSNVRAKIEKIIVQALEDGWLISLPNGKIYLE